MKNIKIPEITVAILVPLGENPDEGVINSIQMQENVSVNISVIIGEPRVLAINPTNYGRKATEEEIDTYKKQFRQRILSISRNRNKCIEFFKKIGDDNIGVLNDGDVKHIKKDDFKNMYNILSSAGNSAVAIKKRDFQNHIENGCVMTFGYIWSIVDYTPNENECTCLAFSRIVSKFGFYKTL